MPAVIHFVGNWDIQNGALVFMSNIKTAPAGAPQVSLAFAGKLKGVTVGFALFSGPGNTELAFNITGKHAFRSGDLTWASSIGFTGKEFDATVNITTHQVIDGHKLSLKGTLHLKDPGGNAHAPLDLSLEAEYDFDEHEVLVFKAAVDDHCPTPSYDLMLTGTFQYSNLNLTFSVDLNNTAGAQAVNVAVGIQGNKDSMIKNLALVLNVTEGQASTQLDLHLTVRLQFEDGVRVKVKQPVPASRRAAERDHPLKDRPEHRQVSRRRYRCEVREEHPGWLGRVEVDAGHVE